MKIRHLLLLALAAGMVPLGAQERALPVHEQGVVLNASDLLPAEWLRGPSHRVREQVVTDGYMAHFEVDTDFGTFRAAGVPQVRERIKETEAIRKLVETSKSDLFAEGLKRSVEKPIDAVKNIVADPVKSVKQAPKTVGHFFSKVGASIGRGVDKISERSKEDDPGDTRETAAQIGNAAKSAAGFDQAKLDTARQLGVDPYSDNPRLQEEMDKVTWAFFAGGLPLRIVATAASAGIALAGTEMIGIPEDTYTLTAGELAVRDAKMLQNLGASDAQIRRFQIHPVLTVTRRHRVATLLDSLPRARDRASIVSLANTCEAPAQADILIAALTILSQRQQSGAADYVELKVLGRLPAGLTAAGQLEVPAPVDHVTWTEEVARFAQRDDLGTAPKTLVHTGRLSGPTAAGLTEAGWKTVAITYPAR